MEALLTWSLKSSAILIVLFSCYFFLFRNSTVFKLRRTLLLIILTLSCLAPLVKLEISSDEQPLLVQHAVQFKSNTIDQIKLSPSEATAQVYTIPEEKAKSINWEEIAVYSYAIGIWISLSLLLFELGKVAYLRFTGKKEPELGKAIFRHRLVSSPFSFYRSIFIPEESDYSEPTWKTIATHEQAHIDRRHSLDLLFARVIQSLTWFNPIIYLLQKELRSVHEAQADEQVLKSIGFSAYAQTLMQVSLPGYQLPIGHSFAVISSFSKRLKLMKTHKTRLRTTVVSLIIISVFSVGIIGWSSLTGQEKEQKQEKSASGAQTFLIPEKQLKMMNIRAKEEGYPEVSSREEALEIVKRNVSQPSNSFYYFDKLPSRLTNKMDKLQEIYPNKEIQFQYISQPSNIDYQGTYFDNSSPLYISELTYEDKEELIKLSLSDSSRARGIGHVSRTHPVYFFSIYDYKEEYISSMRSQISYVMFYEVSKESDSEIYDESEVDVKPEPVGGKEAFERAIALDIKVPESVNKDDLPEYIDYSAVIYGGRQIGNVNLLTELKGSYEDNKETYLFLGELMQEIQNKTRQFYTWKRGIKNNQQVKVRVKISIPTKYMM